MLSVGSVEPEIDLRRVIGQPVLQPRVPVSDTPAQWADRTEIARVRAEESQSAIELYRHTWAAWTFGERQRGVRARSLAEAVRDEERRITELEDGPPAWWDAVLSAGPKLAGGAGVFALVLGRTTAKAERVDLSPTAALVGVGAGLIAIEYERDRLGREHRRALQAARERLRAIQLERDLTLLSPPPPTMPSR